MESVEEAKNRFILQKRQRNNYELLSKPDITQKYQHLMNNGQFIITLKLKNEKAKLIIKCSAIDIQKEYSICFSLENLKEKYMIFNICKTLEDAFKIFMNLFNNEKAQISKPENTDSIYLNLTIPNYIENREENICIQIMKTIKINDCRDSKFLTKILKENPDINFSYDLIKTIDNLSKKDLAKEREIQKLNVLLNDSLRDISAMKKDIEVMKKKLNISEISNSPNISFNYTEFNKSDVNSNLINLKKFGNNQELEGKQKEEEEIEDEEEEDKEYEKEEDTEKIREKLKQNLMTIKEEKGKNKENDKDYKGNTINNIVQIKTRNVTPIRMKKEKENNKEKSNGKEKEDENSPLKFTLINNIVGKPAVKYLGDNNFAVFETLNGDILVVYGTINNSMNIFDVEKNRIIKSIREAHKSQISNFRHIRDNIIKRDLLLTVSDGIKNIKVWEIPNGNCILNLVKIYDDGYIFSACFLIDEICNISYVIAINYDYFPMKIYDLEGKNVRNINNHDDKSYMVDSYYHPELKQYFVIVGNENFIKSYHFTEATLYKKYYDNSPHLHMYFTILYKDSKTFLIEADIGGYFRIWNFDTAELIKKILIKDKMKLRGLCLWNEKYVLVGSSDKTIKIVDLSNYQINNFRCGDLVCTIKKVKNNKLGECLFIQGRSNSGIIKMYKCL